jgi:hypothetical protein
MRNQKILSVALIIMLAMLACNLPGTTQPPSLVNDRAATIIIETLPEDLQNNTEVSITATFSLTPNPSQTPTSTPAGTITPTYSVPILTVKEQTNCRTGPGQSYEIVFTYLAGKKLEIVGRYDPDNYWLVKSSESPSGVCWLWGEFVEVTGSYWVVSSVTPPPTATLPPPQAPSIQKWDFFCTTVSGEMTITILWTDRAGNETGYRIIRDDVPVAELPANSGTYTETILLATGESATYIIEVYNSSGSVRSSPIKLTC